MNIGTLILMIIAGLVLAVAGIVIYMRIPKKLKSERYAAQWKEIQGYCRNKTDWPKALAEADKLLDMALKRRKIKGGSMGERMVSAQRLITNNDSMWFGHNLYKKVLANPNAKLSEADVKAALLGFRQALKDIGAIKNKSQADMETENSEKGTKSK